METQQETQPLQSPNPASQPASTKRVDIPAQARQIILKMFAEIDAAYRKLLDARQTFALFLQFTKRELKVPETNQIWDIDAEATHFFPIEADSKKLLPTDLSMTMNAPSEPVVTVSQGGYAGTVNPAGEPQCLTAS